MATAQLSSAQQLLTTDVESLDLKKSNLPNNEDEAVNSFSPKVGVGESGRLIPSLWARPPPWAWVSAVLLGKCGKAFAFARGVLVC